MSHTCPLLIRRSSKFKGILLLPITIQLQDSYRIQSQSSSWSVWRRINDSDRRLQQRRRRQMEFNGSNGCGKVEIASRLRTCSIMTLSAAAAAALESPTFDDKTTLIFNRTGLLAVVSREFWALPPIFTNFHAMECTIKSKFWLKQVKT